MEGGVSTAAVTAEIPSYITSLLTHSHVTNTTITTTTIFSSNSVSAHIHGSCMPCMSRTFVCELLCALCAELREVQRPGRRLLLERPSEREVSISMASLVDE